MLSQKRRILVSASKSLDGAFIRVKVYGQKKDASGKCFSYMAVSQEQQGSSLSVLLVPHEEECMSSDDKNRKWVVTGIVIGICGSLLITCGIMWVARDIFQRWARGTSNKDEENLIT